MRWGRARAVRKCGNVRSVRLFFKPDAPVPQVAGKRGFRDGMPQRRERHDPCEQTRLSKRGNVRPVRLFFKPDAPVPPDNPKAGLQGASGTGCHSAGNGMAHASKRGNVRSVRLFFKPVAPVPQVARRRGFRDGFWGRGRFPPGLRREAPRLNSRLWCATTPSPSRGQAPKYIV